MTSATTELQAVNQMLSSVGGAAVVSLDTDNPEVTTAQSILNETTRHVLAEEWNYNTEYEYPLAPETGTGYITVPDNIYNFHLNTVRHNFNKYDLVVRNGRLYDRTAKTDSFTETIYVDVVWYFPFADLPQAFKEYITTRASRVYASRLVGSTDMVELLQTDEAIARSNVITYDTTNDRPNMLNDFRGRTQRATYHPYQTLIR